MPRKKGSPKNPKAVAAGKKAWRAMSPAKKAAAKKRLARFRFTKGGGTSPAASSRPASNPASRGGGTTGENKKRKKVDPIPVIGVRGSSTKVSAMKLAAAGAVVSVAAISATGTAAAYKAPDLEEGIARANLRAKEIWANYGGRILLGGAALLLFGKSFDRRNPDFPIRLGK